MDSWLRKAERLFEVVDRRAKLVVSELSDEQFDSQSSASNGQGSQAKRTQSNTKAGKIAVGDEIPKPSDSTQEQSPNTHTSQSNINPVKDGDALLNENEVASSGKAMVQRSNEKQPNLDDDSSKLSVPVTETSANGANSSNVDHLKIPASSIDGESSLSTSNVVGSNSEVHEENSLMLPSVGGEVMGENHSADVDQNNKLDGADDPKKIDQENSHSISSDASSSIESEFKAVNIKDYSVASQKNQREHKTDASSQTVQEQLDEAQGLLKTAISTGQSKEARMARVCAGISARLREKKSENEQLEELLVAERELSKSYEVCIKQLQEDLSASKDEVTRIESNMAEALVAKNAEIETLVSSMDACKKQAALSEGNLASLQANMESMMRNRELAETRMMQALREELASAERRAEEERAAHNATKKAAMEREVELGHRAMEGSTALARIQSSSLPSPSYGCSKYTAAKGSKTTRFRGVRATRFLWRYPTARVIMLFYLVFVHLFLMYLLHRLQEQADEFSAREIAESMGLP